MKRLTAVFLGSLLVAIAALLAFRTSAEQVRTANKSGAPRRLVAKRVSLLRKGHSLPTAALNLQGATQSSVLKRKFTPKTFKDMPVVIREVRNLQNEENWFRDLEIEVKNVSDKPIYFIAIGIEFPEISASAPEPREDGSTPARSVTGFTLTYGNRRLGVVSRLAAPEDVSIKPGEIYVFRIPEARVKGLKNMQRGMGLPLEAADNIEVRFDVISFGDGTGFVAGRKRDYRGHLPRSQSHGNPIFTKIGWNRVAPTKAAIQTGCGLCNRFYIEFQSEAYCIATDGTICQRDLARTNDTDPCSRYAVRHFYCSGQPCSHDYIVDEDSQSCPQPLPDSTPTPTPTPAPSPTPSPTPCSDMDNDLWCADALIDRDCRDDDPSINPGQTENCFNGIDDNCRDGMDGEDPQCKDSDGDGEVDFYDCEPQNPQSSHLLPENCYDGIDNDCDYATDTQDSNCSSGGGGGGGGYYYTQDCTQYEWVTQWYWCPEGHVQVDESCQYSHTSYAYAGCW